MALNVWGDGGGVMLLVEVIGGCVLINGLGGYMEKEEYKGVVGVKRVEVVKDDGGWIRDLWRLAIFLAVVGVVVMVWLEVVDRAT